MWYKEKVPNLNEEKQSAKNDKRNHQEKRS